MQAVWAGSELSISEINVDRAAEDFGANFLENIPRKAILVKSILKRSPAEEAGIQPGDILISIDGKIPEDEADFIFHNERSGREKM